jgi:sugar/nucleoside kinase (ribokinase family)
VDRAFDLLVLGDANPDVVLRGDVEPAFGQAERLVDEARTTIGGSGAIVACAAARLGLRVALCSVVGDDVFGRWMREQVAERGVDVSAMVIDAERPTGLTVVLSRGDDRAILTHLGTIAELRASLIRDELLEATRHVHVSSYFLQRELAPHVPELFDRAHAAGATTSIDPNWDPADMWNGGLTDALTRTDVFLPNAVEARRITKQNDAEAAAVRLAEKGPLVVVKLGADGSLAARDRGVTRAGAPSIDPVDSTGAGDAFDAGFLASWQRGDPVERSLALANACGALSTGALGGVEGQPTMDEVLDAIG